MRLIAASVLASLNIIFAGIVIREFGWLEFRIVGASDALQRKIALFRPNILFNVKFLINLLFCLSLYNMSSFCANISLIFPVSYDMLIEVLTIVIQYFSWSK